MGRLKKIVGYVAIGALALVIAGILILSLPVGGWRALSVQTGSMKPAIDPGALVLVKHVPVSALQVGDIITYTSRTSPGKTVTHRITKIAPLGNGKNMYTVKGDANMVVDAPVQESQIVGEVTRHVPYLGRLIDFVHSIPGLIVMIYIPAVVIAVYELRLLFKRLMELETEPAATTAGGYGLRMVHPARSKLYGEDQFRDKTRRPSAAPLVVVAGLAVASLGGYQTFAALTAPGVTLASNSIATAPAATTPPPQPPANPGGGSTTITNSTNITITNNNPQNATSGAASATGTTNAGNVQSGSAANSSTTTGSASIGPTQPAQ